MDTKQGFEQALSQYRQVYVQVGLARQPENALQEPRNKIMAALQRLQNLVDAESREIRDFAKEQRDKRAENDRLATKAQNLETELTQSRDDLEKTKRIVGETPPAPDYGPLYKRVGVVTGLFILVVGLQIARARM